MFFTLDFELDAHNPSSSEVETPCDDPVDIEALAHDRHPSRNEYTPNRQHTKCGQVRRESYIVPNDRRAFGEIAQNEGRERKVRKRLDQIVHEERHGWASSRGESVQFWFVCVESRYMGWVVALGRVAWDGGGRDTDGDESFTQH